MSLSRIIIVNLKSIFKNLLGLCNMKYDDIKDEAEAMPYSVFKSSNGNCSIKINGEDYTPQSISAQVLSKLKASAESTE